MQTRHFHQTITELQDEEPTVADIGKKIFPGQAFKGHQSSWRLFRFGDSLGKDHPTTIGKGGIHPNAQEYEVVVPYLAGLVLNIFGKNSTGEGGLLMVLEVQDICSQSVPSFVEVDRSRCSSHYPCALRLPTIAVAGSAAGQPIRFRTRVIQEDEDYETDMLEYEYLRLDYDGEVQVARQSFNAKVKSDIHPTKRSMTFPLNSVLAAGALAVTPIIENKNLLTEVKLKIRQLDISDSSFFEDTLLELHGLEAELSSYRPKWASEWRVATESVKSCDMSYFEVVADQLFPGEVELEIQVNGSGQEVLRDVLVTTRVSWAEAEIVLIDTVLKDSFGLFLDPEHIVHGLPLSALDRGESANLAHSNPTEWGYAMESWVVMAETGSITKEDAAAKLNESLSTMRTLQKDPKEFVHGLFYPFYQLKNKTTGASQFPTHTDLEDIPCGDDALLYSSLLVVQGWLQINGFKREQKLCSQLVSSMDFSHCVRKTDCKSMRKDDAPEELASDKFWSVPLTFNGKTLEPSNYNWNVWADEGGIVAMVVALTGATSDEQYESIVREQQRYSPCASWEGITVGHAAFFNSVFTLPTRSMVGFGTLFESPYYHEFAVRSLLPSFRAYQKLKQEVSADYIGASDAMSMSPKSDPSKNFGSYAYFPPNNMYDCSVGKVTMENQCTWCKGIQYEGLNDPFDMIVPHGNMAAFLASAMMERTQFSAWLEDTKKLMTDSSKMYEPGYGAEVLAPSKRKEDGAKFKGGHQGRGIWESLSQGYTILSIYEGLATIHRRYELAKKAGFKVRGAYKPPSYKPLSDFTNSLSGVRANMNSLLQVAWQQESTEKYCKPSDFGIVSFRHAHKRR